MPRDEGEAPMVQCGKCGRAVWSNHVNKAGNCATCSPPRADKADDEDKPAT